MPKDKIETIGNSAIQHGPYNSRIYLMTLSHRDLPSIIDRLKSLAQKNKYEKIFCKVPSKFDEFFTERGYKKEGVIPKYFNGLTDLSFLSLFLSEERENKYDSSEIEGIIKLAKEKSEKPGGQKTENKFKISPAAEKDAPALSEIYKTVFKTYPFPIHDPEYIIKTMKENISYFKASYEGKIISASSAEKDIKAQSVEMTDFATLPSFRGNNIAVLLLEEMEKLAVKEGYLTLYTIARAASPGMNITFARKKYNYSGTLINNTNISGSIESMNVWYKNI